MSDEKISARKKALYNHKNLNIIFECLHDGKKQNHHPDYSRPYLVVRLCPMCHRSEHVRLNKVGRKNLIQDLDCEEAFDSTNEEINSIETKTRQNLLIQMDLLKRAFGITAGRIYRKAGIKYDSYGNAVLHGRKVARPSIERIEEAIRHFKFSKKLKQPNF